MRRRRARSIGQALALAALASTTAPRRASAQAPDAARADALYREGKAALDAAELDRACPLLEESFRLDPATGALLALAVCEERRGRVATAHAAFEQVATRSRAAGEVPRAAAAEERARALAPRLPRWFVVLAPAVCEAAGLTASVDGRLVAIASLGAPVPIDPGPHRLELRDASGRTGTWTWEAKEGTTSRIDAADLRRDGPPEPSANLSPGPAPDGAAPAGSGWSELRWTGAALVGLGGASAIGGVVLGALALGEAGRLRDDLGYDEAASTCPTANLGACGEAYDSATTLGTLSTSFLVAGSALAATGAVLFVVGGDGEAQGTGIELRASASGVRWDGRF
jgi:hypothetical protein